MKVRACDLGFGSARDRGACPCGGGVGVVSALLKDGSGFSAPLKDGATIFGNQAATVSPFQPSGTVSMIHLSVVQQGKPTHPSPSAR
jgi:hypothetical protein